MTTEEGRSRLLPLSLRQNRGFRIRITLSFCALYETWTMPCLRRSKPQIPPNVMVYNTTCNLWRHIERQRPGLLANKESTLPRLPASGLVTAHLPIQMKGNAPIGVTARDVTTQPLGRVYYARLTHLGDHVSSLRCGS